MKNKVNEDVKNEEIIKDNNENIDNKDSGNIEKENDDKSINNKINKSKKKIFIKSIIAILLALILGYFILMKLAENNEEIEVKIIGEKNSINWSNTSENLKNSKDFKEFKKLLNEQNQKFDKTIVIFNQFTGCGSCIDELLKALNSNVKQLNNKKIGVLLVTTLDEDYINSVYKEEYKLIDIISDSNLEISRNMDIYNEEYSQVEKSILVIENENLESYLDEYYYEKDEEIIEYINNYINK